MKQLSRFCTCRQDGQALIEALGVLAALLALLHAVNWLGRLQFQSLALGQMSRAAAFAAAQGDDVPVQQAGTDLRASRQDADDSLALGIGNTARAALVRDWLAVAPRLLDVEAWREVAADSGFESGGERLVLRRHTVLATGDGRGASDEATQHRLANSRAGWLSAAGDSLGMARDLRGRLGSIEAAWGQRAPGDDWVQRWRDLVPAERVEP